MSAGPLTKFTGWLSGNLGNGGIDNRLVQGSVDVEIEERLNVFGRHLGDHLSLGGIVGLRLETQRPTQDIGKIVAATRAMSLGR
jgi:hypothetical protein